MMTYVTLFLVFIFGFFVFMSRLSPISSTAASAAFEVIGATWFGGLFMGTRTPDGTGFVIFCLLFGILMTAVASVRIEMFPHRKAYILRGLTLLLFAFQFLALDMAWINAWYKRGGAAVMVAVHPPIGVLMLTAMALMLLTPIFATGILESFEARRFTKYLLWGCTPGGLKRGKLASGIPFLVLTTLFCIGLYGLSFVFAGQVGAITKSGALSLGLPGVPPPDPVKLTGKPGETVTLNGSSVLVQRTDGTWKQATRLPNGTVQVNNTTQNGQSTVVIQPTWPSDVPVIPPPPPPRVIVTPRTGDFTQGVLVLFVSVIGFGMLNVLFSIVMRRRWLAIVVAYIVLLLIFIVPEISMSFAHANSEALPADAPISMNLMYLNPVQAFLQMCEPASYWQGRFLWFGQTPMWQVITEMWAIIGTLSFLVMVPFVRRIANENEPIPYEEQVLLS
jgi:hypothetical protein